ncbi:MAG: hypothetical protein FWG67_05695 [Defluviitaleaceae bacterium]|nr:hypothetical protein [Defluviitaleaceae bacterium]
MFKVKYRVAKEGMHFPGDMGYYQMFYNENVYGETIYSEDIEDIMGTEHLYIWFEAIIQIALDLHSKTYVALNDFESPKHWLEFKKNNDDLNIRVVLADKPNGTLNVAYELKNKTYETFEFGNTKISFKDFKKELIEACTLYIKDIVRLEQNEYGKEQIVALRQKLDQLLHMKLL